VIAETITGAAGAETITGAAGAETITGAAGAETITGAAGAETITDARWAPRMKMTAAKRQRRVPGAMNAPDRHSSPTDPSSHSNAGRDAAHDDPSVWRFALWSSISLAVVITLGVLVARLLHDLGLD